nr:hypothetical protein [Thermoleophilaceae bacterium]
MTESREDESEAEKDVDERTPEGHDPGDTRGGGGAGGEAGALPGVPAEERTNEEGHGARDEDSRDSEDD